MEGGKTNCASTHTQYTLKLKVMKGADLRRGGGEGHEGEVLALLGEVVVGDGEAQHLEEVL